MYLTRLISGGQTGVDQGAIFACVEWNCVCAVGDSVSCGGFMPHRFLTEEGPAPWLRDYGMCEHSSSKYVIRTEANIKDSDGVLRIAAEWNSPGTVVTEKIAKCYGRPYIDIAVQKPVPANVVAAWILDKGIKRLNVAGNRESVAPGIHDFTAAYILDLLTEIRKFGDAPTLG